MLSRFAYKMATRDMASKPARWENPLHPMAGPYVYDFSEAAELGRELLGGKGAGLAEMTAIGIPAAPSMMKGLEDSMTRTRERQSRCRG